MKTTYYGQLILELIDKPLWSSNTRLFLMPGFGTQRLHFGQTNRFPVILNLDDEKMDAFELGWRTRPSDRLLIELSLYHYHTRMQFFRGHLFTVLVM